MLGFSRTDNDTLVSCLGDPQRTAAAYRELLQRGHDALGAIRAGLRHDARRDYLRTHCRIDAELTGSGGSEKSGAAERQRGCGAFGAGGR